jgi:hypothetical protein
MAAADGPMGSRRAVARAFEEGRWDMKKLSFAMVILALLVAVPMALAQEPPEEDEERSSGPAGASNVAFLYLWETDADGEIVDSGAWGKLKYNLQGARFEFLFNGHGLEREGDYTLITFPDPWPATGLICLGRGFSNRGGNLHMKGAVDTGNLPAAGDENYPDGARIRLVLSADVDCEARAMTAWNPEAYLFEDALIRFEAVEAEPEGEQGRPGSWGPPGVGGVHRGRGWGPHPRPWWRGPWHWGRAMRL